MPKRKKFVPEFNKNRIEISPASRRLFRKIRDGVEDGETGASMLRRFRASGFRIKTQDFYQTVRLAKSYRESGRSIKFAPNNQVIPDEKIPLVPDHIIMRGNYQYVVKVSSSHKDDLDSDGKPKVIYLTVRSAQNLSKLRIKELTGLIAEHAAEKNNERYEFVGTNIRIEVVEAYRRV